MTPHEIPGWIGAEVSCAQRAEEKQRVSDFSAAVEDNEWAESLEQFDPQVLDRLELWRSEAARDDKYRNQRGQEWLARYEYGVLVPGHYSELEMQRFALRPIGCGKRRGIERVS